VLNCETVKDTARVFRALADPTRRQILQELKRGELAAGAITARFDISAPAISRHLAILKSADLVSERRDGNRIYYRLEADQLAAHLGDFLSQVCPTQFRQRRRIARKAAS
jgi:DNA-binding transcriptional ArsR family regulator